MQVKPTILVFTGCYLPGFRAGGPIRSIAHMVERLSDEYTFRIVTLSRDIGETQNYDDVPINKWTPCGKAKALYLEPRFFALNTLRKIISSTQPDVLYLNSFFDRNFSQPLLWASQLARHKAHPIVIAPRGEFSEGALSIKPRRKATILNLARQFRLFRTFTWQASSIYERRDIARALPHLDEIRIKIACDLPSVTQPPSERKQRSDGSPLRICFLSRIVPIKNVEFALNVLARVDVTIDFTIWGPKEDLVYWGRCLTLISSLPPNVRVEYRGQISPDKVHSELANHDLFFFPSLGENYGHVIYEALGAGLRVLLSDKTPWRDFGDDRIGLAISLHDPDSFVSVIEEMHTWTERQHAASAELARRYAAAISVDSRDTESNMRLFEDAIRDQRSQPSY